MTEVLIVSLACRNPVHVWVVSPDPCLHAWDTLLTLSTVKWCLNNGIPSQTTPVSEQDLASALITTVVVKNDAVKMLK